MMTYFSYDLNLNDFLVVFFTNLKLIFFYFLLPDERLVGILVGYVGHERL